MNIYIIGSTGSGKSTLAQALAKHWGLRVVELDHYLFLPGWRQRPKEEFVSKAQEATATPGWIASGNYSTLRSYLKAKAGQIIWLDYPFWIVFWRLLKRTLRRIFTKEPCCNGNYETWRLQFFSKQSIFLWLWQTHWKYKKIYGDFLKNPATGPKMIRLRSPRETEAYLRSLPAAPRASVPPKGRRQGVLNFFFLPLK